MSFRCQMCQTQVPAGTRALRVVVESRPKVYESRGYPREDGRGRMRARRPPARSQAYDKGGEGTEIVRELVVCARCAENHQPLETASTLGLENDDS